MVPNPLQPEVFEEEDCTENDCSDSSLASSLQHMASHNSTVSETAATTKAKVVDSMLSKEMYHLSVANRNAINEEIHGARCIAPEESPELIKQSLLDLQRCLDGMPYKPAYDRAQAYAQHPLTAGTSYVNTIEFRLKFLRCELFSVRAAAIRLINYLELVFEMYGLFALQRKVLISDFSKHEMQILRAGYFQIFPFRDRSGRRVMCIVGNMGIEFDPIIRLKAYFYFWMAASEDLESQQKGVVFIVWPGSSSSARNIPSQNDRELHKKCNAAAPIRVAAVHFCYPDEPFFHILRSVMAMTMSITYRLRLKFHVGESVELNYILKSYGIPVDLTPITDSGNIKTSYLKQWLRLRKVIECGMTPDGTRTNTLSIIECPRSNDVIFRPGTSMLCHPGNVVFRGQIEAKLDRVTVKRSEKEEVAMEIIKEVKDSGGRFLMWDNGGWWSELHDIPMLSTKISISYRDFKMKLQAAIKEHSQNKQQKIDASTFAFVNQDGRKRKWESGSPGCI